MELEKIAWGAWGLVSCILLIVYLRWAGPVEDQEKDELHEEPKDSERQAENDSINPR